jgi:small-conductance mechanosensitive channel
MTKPALFLSLLLCACTALALPAGKAGAPAAAPEEAEVLLDGKPVLKVRASLLELSAQDRALQIGERLRELSEADVKDIRPLQLKEGPASTDIVSGALVIMSVTDGDAAAAGLTRQELAHKKAGTLRAALASYRASYTTRSLLLGGLLALLSLVLFALALKFIASVYAASLTRLDAWAVAHIRSIRIQQLELLNAARITVAITLLLKSVRVAVTLLLIYFYIPLLFSFFPWTRGYSPVLFGYILHPLASLLKSFFGYIPDLIFIAVTVTVVHYLLNLLRVVSEELRAGNLKISGFYPDWAKPTFQIARFITWAFTLVIIFPYLPGSSSPAFKGISVFLGVLFSLGSTSAIGNIVAGLMLTYMRPFKTGDRVKIGDTTGDVLEKTLLVTRIRTIKNVSVTMPNALILGSHIINYSALSEEGGIILNTTVTIGYDAPWPKVHQLLIAAAEATPGMLKEPKPFVLQKALNDYHVSYELNAYTEHPKGMAAAYSALHANIQDQFNAAGVEIMSPAFTGLRDAGAPARPGTARSPGFKVNLAKDGA